MAIFTDDFNTYNDGDLNGQGNWSGATEFQIQGTLTYEGAKAVQISGTAANKNIEKTGNQLAAGVASCYIRQNATDINGARFVAYEVATGGGAGLYFYSDAKIYGSIDGISLDLGSYSANTWHFCEMEWRSSPSHQVRYRIDQGTWTSWSAPATDWTIGPDAIRLRSRDSEIGDEIYWDYINEAPWSSSSSSSSSSLSSSSSSSSSSSFSSSSSSSSSSSFSSSFSSSSSSSVSTYPTTWGIAWGEQNPIGESPESWATWSDGAGGNPTIIGDADWGKLQLGKDEIAHSPVHYFNTLDSQTTLIENKYGSGVGSFKLYYRESDTPFNQDDATPAWNLYTNPVRLTKAFRQVKLVGE